MEVLRRTNRLATDLVVAAAVIGFACRGLADAPDRWKPHAEVGVLHSVEVRVYWHETSAELRQTAQARKLKARGLQGFSVLRGNPKTGKYVCEIFARKMSGASVDEDRTLTIGHELLHCLGLSHD